MATCCKTKLPRKYVRQMLFWNLGNRKWCDAWPNFLVGRSQSFGATSNSKLTNDTSLEAWTFMRFWVSKYFKIREFILPRHSYSNLRTVKTCSSRNTRSVDTQLCNLHLASLNGNTSSFWCKIVIVAQLHWPCLSQARTTWEETQLCHKWAQSEISRRILTSVTPSNCRQADSCLLAPNNIHCNYHSFPYSFPSSTG
jgi:hypothetical protein